MPMHDPTGTRRGNRRGLVGEAGEAEVLGLTSLDAMAPGHVVYLAGRRADWPRSRRGLRSR